MLVMCQGKRVVYLPNCGGAYKNLAWHLRQALLMAFGDDASENVRRQIAKFRTQEEIAEFCLTRAGSQQPLIFVLDQFNGIQEDSTAQRQYEGSRQDRARDFLDQVCRCWLSVVA